MAETHTQGPWEWRDVPGAGLQIWGTVDLGGEKVEATERPHGPRLRYLYDVSLEPQLRVGKDGRAYVMLSYEAWRQFPTVAFDEMQRANARLIAAAPDLLAALKAMMRYYDTPSGPAELLAQAEAAIAKADPPSAVPPAERSQEG